MDITLSFNKWYEGNGLIYDLELYGLNGKLYKLRSPSPPVVTQLRNRIDSMKTSITNMTWIIMSKK